MDDALPDNPDCPGCQARDEGIEELTSMVEQMHERIAELEGKVRSLEARLDQDSSNSSKPPSSDGPAERAERPSGAESDRSQGAQPGHEGHHRPEVEPEDVDDVVECRPDSCTGCGHSLTGHDEAPKTHQVTDVDIQVRVTEYRLHRLECACCGTHTQASLPDTAPSSRFGPTISAIVTYLTGDAQLSRRTTQQAAAELFGVQMSLGTVSNLEGRLTDALAPGWRAARGWVRGAERVHLDETMWWHTHEGQWLWTATTDEVAIYTVDPSRGGQVARQLLDGQPGGQVVTDRHTAYNWIATEKRFLCWPHLLRNFKGWELEGGLQGDIGGLLASYTRELFAWLQRIRDGTVESETFEQAMADLRSNITTTLRVGAHASDSPKRYQSLLDLDEAMWAFVDADGWPTDNNAAERALRPAVLWRKRSFGTQSDRGCRYVERMLTVVETLKRQGRRTMDFLEEMWSHISQEDRQPALLPA